MFFSTQWHILFHIWDFDLFVMFCWQLSYSVPLFLRTNSYSTKLLLQYRVVGINCFFTALFCFIWLLCPENEELSFSLFSYLPYPEIFYIILNCIYFNIAHLCLLLAHMFFLGFFCKICIFFLNPFSEPCKFLVLIRDRYTFVSVLFDWYLLMSVSQMKHHILYLLKQSFYLLPVTRVGSLLAYIDPLYLLLFLKPQIIRSYCCSASSGYGNVIYVCKHLTRLDNWPLYL